MINNIEENVITSRKNSYESEDIFLQPIDQHYYFSNNLNNKNEMEHFCEEYEQSGSFKTMLDYMEDSTDMESDISHVTSPKEISEESGERISITKFLNTDWRKEVKTWKQKQISSIKERVVGSRLVVGFPGVAKITRLYKNPYFGLSNVESSKSN